MQPVCTVERYCLFTCLSFYLFIKRSIECHTVRHTENSHTMGNIKAWSFPFSEVTIEIYVPITVRLYRPVTLNFFVQDSAEERLPQSEEHWI